MVILATQSGEAGIEEMRGASEKNDKNEILVYSGRE